MAEGVGFDAVTRRVTATPGSRPNEKKGQLYRMARALEFPRLRRGNSVGSMRHFVSANNRGAHSCGARPCCWRRGWDSNPWFLSETPVFKTGSLNHSDTPP